MSEEEQAHALSMTQIAQQHAQQVLVQQQVKDAQARAAAAAREVLANQAPRGGSKKAKVAPSGGGFAPKPL